MLIDTLSELNWLAVILATVAYFIIGGIWYMPAVFGKAWMKSMGIDSQDQVTPNAMTIIAPLFFYFLTVTVLAMLAKVTETMMASDGIILGIVAWAGFALPLTAVLAVYDPKKVNAMSWAVITSSYHLVSLVAAGVILGVMS